MMDSFELTKIAGGVLLALLVIVAPRTFIDLAHQSGHHAELKDGYTLPAPTETAAGGEGGGAAAQAYDYAKVVASLSTANPENGAATFKKCQTCHTADKAAGSKAGPNLWDVVGRERGTRADFTGYSEAMKNKKGAWTYDDLAHFIHKPKEFLPGTKMLFAGVSDPGELADLLAYIHTLSDSPQPFPAAPAASATPAAGEPAQEGGQPKQDAQPKQDGAPPKL